MANRQEAGVQGSHVDYGPNEEKVMECPNCGKENPEGFVYCGFCGRRLKSPSPENRLEVRSRKTLAKVLAKEDKEMLDFMLYKFREASSKNPEYADIYFDLSMIYRAQERFEEAINELKKALNINPEFGDAHHALADIYFHINQPENAIYEYRKALRISPDYADLHFGLGKAFEKLGNKSKALDEYEEAVKINPNYWEAKDAFKRLDEEE